MLKYPKMVQSYSNKDILWWIDRQPDLNTILYNLSEKLDGANFQMVGDHEVTMDTLDLFSRNQLTSWSFFNVQAIQGEIEEFFIPFIRNMSELHSGSKVHVFGELTGPNINGRVKYAGLNGSGLNFKVFDVFAGINFLSTFDLYMYFRGTNWLIPQVANVHGLFPALSYNQIFKSLLSPEGIENNDAEGIVIRPAMQWVGYAEPDGSYRPFVLKKKNPSFEDDSKKKGKVAEVVDGTILELRAIFDSYISENRIIDYFSKNGVIQSKQQIGEYIQGIIRDAETDMANEVPAYQCLSTKDRNLCYGQAQKKVAHRLLQEL